MTKDHRHAALLKLPDLIRMSDSSVKQEAYRLVEKLSDDATWDDLMYETYVRQAIEAGLEDSKADRSVDVHEVRARFRRSE